MKNKKFESDIKKGKVGENIVYHYLTNTNFYDKIINVSEDKDYQQNDIDFILIKDNKNINIEVKTDYITQTSNNICFEIISSKSIGSNGCMFKTKADYIFYYIVGKELIYIFNTKQTIKVIKDKLLNVTSYPFGIEKKYCGDNAIGFMIPYYRLDDLGIKYIKINI